MRGVLLMLSAICSVQIGAALAAGLIPRVGAWGTVSLRLVLATLVLAPVCRPRLRGHTRDDWVAVAALALTLAGMNTCLYLALGHLPLGVAVTVEFLGPLTLAAMGSRTLRDGLAVILALAGVVGVSGALGSDWSRVSPVGLALALVAGICWALYARASQAVGVRWPRLEGLWWAMALAALLVTPIGVVRGGEALFTGPVLLTGLAVAVLSSALPYSLEMAALRLIPTRVYGILTGLEPVVAALAGLVVLDQALTWRQVVGMAGVIVASSLVLAKPRAEREAPPTP